MKQIKQTKKVTKKVTNLQKSLTIRSGIRAGGCIPVQLQEPDECPSYLNKLSLNNDEFICCS